MRTTLDLPAALLRRLRQRARREAVPLKTVYNQALGRAFGETYTAPSRRKQAATKSRS